MKTSPATSPREVLTALQPRAVLGDSRELHGALDDDALFAEHGFEQLLGFTRLEVVQAGATLCGARARGEVNVCAAAGGIR